MSMEYTPRDKIDYDTRVRTIIALTIDLVKVRLSLLYILYRQPNK